jgi:hypothetical protein
MRETQSTTVADNRLPPVPDTKEGIENAIKRGANTLWLNTVIHRKHPLFGLYKPVLEGSPTTSLRFVGQLPEHSEDYDDKAVVNPWLANTDETKVLANGFPKSLVLAQKSTSTVEGFDKGMKQIKEELGLPCVLKVRPDRAYIPPPKFGSDLACFSLSEEGVPMVWQWCMTSKSFAHTLPSCSRSVLRSWQRSS